MSRACETCEWWDRDGERPTRTIIYADQQMCKEGPVEVAKCAHDWCGRWRIAERLADGRDARVKS